MTKIANNNDFKNPSGLSDPTAYWAVQNVDKEANIRRRYAMELMKTLRYIANLAGFWVEKIELKDMKSGRKFSGR